MPAVWLPYGSTSVSIKIDHEDLAWVFPRDFKNNLFNPQILNSVLKTISREKRMLLIDSSLPAKVKDFFRGNFHGNMKELPCFDMLDSSPTGTLSIESAYLLSYPHLDLLIEFKGLGENLIPFHSTLWRDFKTDVLEASKSGEIVNLKNYLKDINSLIDLKLIMLAPWAEDPCILLEDNPLGAYEAIASFKQGLLSKAPDSPVELLIISAGGDPFDESLSRALSVFPNFLQGCVCERILLIAEGSMGLGLDTELVLNYNSELEAPLILRYISLCRRFLEGKSVHIVSAIPEPLINMMLDSKAYDTLSDAYKASRLFLPKSSKTGVVTHASFATVRSVSGLKMGEEHNGFK
ncbi:MAG: hypothetical protein QXR97_03415 [Thermoproteota archaeon]